MCGDVSVGWWVIVGVVLARLGLCSLGGSRGQLGPQEGTGRVDTTDCVDYQDKELTRSSTLPDTHDARGPRHPKRIYILFLKINIFEF